MGGEMRKRLARQTRQRLFPSGVLFSGKNKDEYIYVGDAFRKLASWLFFWQKKRGISTRDRLISRLLE